MRHGTSIKISFKQTITQTHTGRGRNVDAMKSNEMSEKNINVKKVVLLS